MDTMHRILRDQSTGYGFYFTKARKLFAGLYYRAQKKKLSV